MSNKILVAVDGSEHSNRTLDRAANVAKADNSEVIILHVTTPHELSDEEIEYAEKRCGHKFMTLVRGDGLPGFQIEGKEQDNFIHEFMRAREIFNKVYSEDLLERAKQKLHDAGIEKVRTISVKGDPAKTICDQARKEDVDLVMLGRRGNNPLAELLLGSIAQKVVQMAKRSVMTVE